MMDAIKMFWTTLYSLLSGVNRLAISFDAGAQVVEVHAVNFSKQELMEAEHKTQELEKKLSKLKEVA